MIHVDVRRDPDNGDYRLETSVNGSGWMLQYLFSHTVGDGPLDTKLRAENAARVFVTACRFCGQDVKATSGGYSL